MDGQDGARGLRDLEATLQALYVYEGFGSNQFITGFRLVLSEMPQNETAPVRRIALSAGQCHPKPE